jgi:hypothetical protein
MARRPTIVVRALNEAARRDSRTVARLLEAVDRLRRAQVAGRRVAEATAEQRAALKGLLDRARAVLAESDRQPTPAVVRRLTATVLGAVADRQGRADLRHGRLRQEYGAPGFGIFADAPRLRLVASPPAPPRVRRARAGTRAADD